MKCSFRFRSVLFAVPSLVALAIVGMGWSGAAQAGLIGYWPMNEGSGITTVDATNNSNISAGTLNAGSQNVASTWVTGHTGLVGDYAIDFKGYSDRVVVPVTSSLGITNSFTIAMWAKSSLNNYPYLIEFSNNANGDARQWFIQGSNNGSDQMYMWSDANTNWRKALGFKEGGGGTAETTLWHHYAFSYSGGVVTPYVDGVAKTTQSISGSPNFPSFTNILIGGKNQNFTSWEGQIDDVVISNTASTPADITAIKNGTYAGMAVPEPSTFALLGIGAVGLIGYALRKRKQAA